jgi:hypothetical protein
VVSLVLLLRRRRQARRRRALLNLLHGLGPEFVSSRAAILAGWSEVKSGERMRFSDPLRASSFRTLVITTLGEVQEVSVRRA